VDPSTPWTLVQRGGGRFGGLTDAFIQGDLQ
jgi:hypothetical protein